MKNGMDPLLDSWFNLLNGQLSFDSKEVKVYPGDPANEDYAHHVILRGESETDQSNGSSFMTNTIVTVDIISVHPVSINKRVANNIDDQIRELLFPTRQCALVTTGFQILNVRPESANYLEDDDGTRKYHRKITRFYHLINQL